MLFEVKKSVIVSAFHDTARSLTSYFTATHSEIQVLLLHSGNLERRMLVQLYQLTHFLDLVLKLLSRKYLRIQTSELLAKTVNKMCSLLQILKKLKHKNFIWVMPASLCTVESSKMPATITAKTRFAKQSSFHIVPRYYKIPRKWTFIPKAIPQSNPQIYGHQPLKHFTIIVPFLPVCCKGQRRKNLVLQHIKPKFYLTLDTFSHLPPKMW